MQQQVIFNNRTRLKVRKIIIGFLACMLVLASSPFPIPAQKVSAQPFVPVYDVFVETLLVQSNLQTLQTAIATAAQTKKSVGSVPGINPIGDAAVNPGTGAALALTSLDGAATLIASTLVRRITDSIVRWIDSGFEGQPAFVRDPEKFFTDVADAVAGEFIWKDENLRFLCEPFEFEIRLALGYQYESEFTDVNCRLSDVLNNVENFAEFTGGNFARGGWRGWFQVVKPKNNVYGAYPAADLELTMKIGKRTVLDEKLLDWGSGFLSFQECLDKDENGDLIEGRTLNECANKGPVKTPGMVIAEGLNETVGYDLTELGMADSFDRIIAALINQLMTRALSSAGLAGASRDIDDRRQGSNFDKELPPAPPTNFTATPISSGQINLSWTASETDEVKGYYIYRNDFKIRTNDGISNTFFPDFGLQPETTYTYKVSAFIKEDNEASTIPVATTTLPLP